MGRIANMPQPVVNQKDRDYVLNQGARVHVRFGDIYNCKVVGFKNDFATVCGPFEGQRWEFTWGVVAAAVREQRPIKVSDHYERDGSAKLVERVCKKPIVIE
jgi:hypothetical protein